MMGAADGEDPTTTLGGGSIVLHKNGNKLMLAGAGSNMNIGAPPGDNLPLATALAEAIGHWSAHGLNPAHLQALHGINLVWADLPGNTLGLASESTNYVWIDRDAAGYGWSHNRGMPEQGRVDLFSTLTHELGHVLGYGHEQLGESLHAGERQVALPMAHGDSQRLLLGHPATQDSLLSAAVFRPAGNVASELLSAASGRLRSGASILLLDEVFRGWLRGHDGVDDVNVFSTRVADADLILPEPKIARSEEGLDDELLAELAAALGLPIL